MLGRGISPNAVDILTNLSIFTRRCWKALSSTLFEKSNQTSEYYVEYSLSQVEKFLAFSCICIYWLQNLNWMVDHLSIFNIQCKWHQVFLYFSHNIFFSVLCINIYSFNEAIIYLKKILHRTKLITYKLSILSSVYSNVYVHFCHLRYFNTSF